MKDINMILPRDKFDFERVNMLKTLERSELIPLLPNLLEWVQDMNWPIAKEVVTLLLKFPKEIIPLIKKVLIMEILVFKLFSYEFTIRFKDLI